MRKKFNNKLSLNKQTISNLEASRVLGGVADLPSLNHTGCAVGVETECPSEGFVTCPTHPYYCGTSDLPFICIEDLKKEL